MSKLKLLLKDMHCNEQAILFMTVRLSKTQIESRIAINSSVVNSLLLINKIILQNEVNSLTQNKSTQWQKHVN